MVFIGSEFNEAVTVYQAADSHFVKLNPPGKIIWLEKVSRQETLSAFADCDVFVLSASFEAQPIVILEAMAYSKPWIARQAGCIGEFPGGICVKNKRTMSMAMRQMASDPKLRKKLGEAGRTAIEAKYQLRQYKERFCQLVEDVVRK